MELETSTADGVVTVRLARTAKRNALTLDFTNDLAAAVESARDAGAIALLADGDHFCVGGDVGAMAGASDPSSFIAELAGTFHRVVRAMRAGPPVVVGARGWSAGAGLSIVLASDIAVAGESASFQPAYPGIGVTPDGGMTWTLPRAVGTRRAAAILLENRVLSAADAHALGIVERVVPDAEIDATALEIAGRIAAGARDAYAGIKRLLSASPDATLDAQLDAEARSIAARAAAPEGREGIAAFAARRTPDFSQARG